MSTLKLSKSVLAKKSYTLTNGLRYQVTEATDITQDVFLFERRVTKETYEDVFLGVCTINDLVYPIGRPNAKLKLPRFRISTVQLWSSSDALLQEQATDLETAVQRLIDEQTSFNALAEDKLVEITAVSSVETSIITSTTTPHA